MSQIKATNNIMSKLTAYQKLKAENEKIKQDLIILATEPDSAMGLCIKMTWKQISETEKSLWMGEYKSTTELGGIISHIK